MQKGNRMNKKLMIGALILGWGSRTWAAWGGDFRAPLDVLYRGHAHFDFVPVHDTWWYDVMGSETDPCCEPSNTGVELWTGAFARYAGKSFLKQSDCANNSSSGFNKSTSQTTSIPTIIFGTPRFKVTESLAGGNVNTTATQTVTTEAGAGTSYPDANALDALNPLLNVFRVLPNFDYSETGAVIGVRVEHRFGCDNKWYVGGSASLPFKVIETRPDEGCGFEEGMEDVVRLVPMNPQGSQTPNLDNYFSEDVAMRLDLLSSVVYRNNQYLVNESYQAPFVIYGDGTNTTDVFYLKADGATGQDVPVLLVRENTGLIQNVAYPYRKVVNATGVSPDLPAQVNPIALAADGSGGANGSTLFFLEGTNYAGGVALDPAAQTQLFVVFPTEDVTDTNLAGQDATKNGDSTTIYQAALQIVRDLSVGDNGPVSFLCDQGIDLRGTQKTVGAGDMDFYLFGGYGHRWDWFAEMELGVRAPTGTKITDAYQILKFPTGNNRHWEMMVGMQGGWKPLNWFAFQLDWSYHHAFARNQPMLATFEGATVKNLGPQVDGKVWWNYFLVHADMTFFHPCNPELGCMFGYELFAKKKDNIDYCQATAVDFLGNTQKLDPCLASQGTNAMLHKIRGEMFHRWSYCELLIGGSTSVGGRHAMKEIEGHITLTVYF